MLSTLAESDSGAPSGDGGYRPGFWDKTVPDGSPLQEPASLDSPGMVSMEITQPLLAAVHQGFGSGEEEEEAVTMQQQQYAPGEVTAGLPSLGALAEADAYEDELLLQQAQLGGSGAGTAGEWQQGAGVDATMNITGGIPGLSSLIAEDEEAEAGGAPMDEATAGMDLTLADGACRQCVHLHLSCLLAALPWGALAWAGARLCCGTVQGGIRVGTGQALSPF